jgi:hypothetical protein
LFWKKRTLTKSKAAIGLASMIFMFLLLVLPYMKLKGAIFPKKSLNIFSSVQQYDIEDAQYNSDFDNFQAGFVPSEVGGAVIKIFENIGDTLMWFFLIPYLIGMFLFFKTKRWFEPDKFFIFVIFILNIPLMVWLYCSHGYMSGRHTLMLIVFTIFFIPTGLQTLSAWLNTRYSKGFQHTHRWFAILMTIGIAVCFPKLFTPLHSDKIAFRDAAQWLAQNTESSAIIGVPDYRISFYAERKGIKILDENIPHAAEYLVKVVKKKGNELEQISPQNFQNIYSLESDKGKKEILIFKRISQ